MRNRLVCVLACCVAFALTAAQAEAALFNVAEGHPATGAPNLTNLTPDKAVDGITDPLQLDENDAKNMYHSATGEADPWWEVDLESDRLVEEVVIYNRDNGTESNAWQNRLHNVYVEVRLADDTVAWTSDVFNPWDGNDVPNNPGPGPFTFDVGGVVGSKVHVRKDTGGLSGSSNRPWLPLTEVQVFIVPEPASVMLLGLGLVAFAAWRRRHT